MKITHDWTREPELKYIDMSLVEFCATCGEVIWDMGEELAEVKRDGQNVRIHSDCLLPGEEIA